MIHLENLCRHFEVGNQIVRALDEVDLEIDKNEYVSIMGVSGSGKSTLLNILGLLDTPTSGSYVLSGVNTSKMNDDENISVNLGELSHHWQDIPLLKSVDTLNMPINIDGFSSGVASTIPKTFF